MFLFLFLWGLRSIKTIGAPTGPRCNSWVKKSLDVDLPFLQDRVPTERALEWEKMAVWSYCGGLSIVAMFFF